MEKVTPLFREANFGPEEISVLSAAYEKARRTLRAQRRAEIVNEAIAERIIRFAQTGERDPEKLAAAALTALGGRGAEG